MHACSCHEQQAPERHQESHEDQSGLQRPGRLGQHHHDDDQAQEHREHECVGVSAVDRQVGAEGGEREQPLPQHHQRANELGGDRCLLVTQQHRPAPQQGHSGPGPVVAIDEGYALRPLQAVVAQAVDTDQAVAVDQHRQHQRGPDQQADCVDIPCHHVDEQWQRERSRHQRRAHVVHQHADELRIHPMVTHFRRCRHVLVSRGLGVDEHGWVGCGSGALSHPPRAPDTPTSRR
ncbi:hypothetical protein D9M70_525410 [compost metagenome]